MLLSPDNIEQINEASLRILGTVGVQIGDAAVRERMVAAGCTPGVDADSLRIPREVIAECVATAPRNFDLYSAAGEARTVGPEGETLFWTCNALNIWEDGAAHPIRKADFVRWTRLTDGLEHVHAAVGPTIDDYPPWSRDFVGFRLLAENTTKHLRPCIYTPDGTLAVIEMAQAMLGATPLRERPIVSFGYTALSPLRWSGTALEVFRKTSGHGVPMMINAEPTAGSTSPVSMAGTLVVSNAEALSGVVITQLLEPGRPVVFNLGFAHTLDMREAITRTGGPENGLLGMAGAQLARYHGLPSASWASTESMCPDAQAAYEYNTVALMHALGGVNIMWGLGQLEAQRTVAPVQGVIDNEIAGAVLRAQAGIDMSPEGLAEDVITGLGHEAGYLGHDHTLERFREELYMPRLAFVGRRERWEQAGATTMAERAQARVEEILAAWNGPKISDETASELRRIQDEWMERLRR